MRKSGCTLLCGAGHIVGVTGVQGLESKGGKRKSLGRNIVGKAKEIKGQELNTHTTATSCRLLVKE